MDVEKTFLRCLLAGVVAIPALAGSPASAKQAAVIATSAVAGETVSCGCKKKDLGGISKRATVINKTRMKNGAALLVDAGDFGSRAEFEPWMRTEFQWQMMREIGYDVVTPGPNELIEGIGPLQDLLSTAETIQVVSANITDKEGNRYWPEFTVVEKSGVTYGVTGVTAESFYAFNKSQNKQKSDDFAFEDVRVSLNRVIPVLQEKSEVVVVLMHTGAADAKRIAEEISGIDVLVVGHNPGFQFGPERVNNTLIIRAGNRGQYVHVLDLTLEDGGKIVEYNGESRPLGDGVAAEKTIDTLVSKFDEKYAALKGDDD